MIYKKWLKKTVWASRDWALEFGLQCLRAERSRGRIGVTVAIVGHEDAMS